MRSDQGEVVRGRCRATNQCAYCARLAAVENAELLALDALAGNAPEVWAVLGTRSADPDPASFYESRRQVMRALKRRWPDVEYAALVEFTTGYGPRSGGLRRPHWNLLLKGIPAADVEQAAEVIRRVWCAREDALPEYQYVGTIREAGGLMRYLALHFQKTEQSPPPGWRGHRFLRSRGYFAGSTAEARAAARESLAFKRELWKALREGLAGEEADRRAQERRARARATTWTLIYVDDRTRMQRRVERDSRSSAGAPGAAGGAQARTPAPAAPATGFGPDGLARAPQPDGPPHGAAAAEWSARRAPDRPPASHGLSPPAFGSGRRTPQPPEAACCLTARPPNG